VTFEVGLVGLGRKGRYHKAKWGRRSNYGGRDGFDLEGGLGGYCRGGAGEGGGSRKGGGGGCESRGGGVGLQVRRAAAGLWWGTIIWRGTWQLFGVKKKRTRGGGGLITV